MKQPKAPTISEVRAFYPALVKLIEAQPKPKPKR